MNYKIFFLDRVNKFIGTLPDSDKAKINGARTAMELGKFEVLDIKNIRIPIKELIIKRYRLLFFIDSNDIYFINAFIKKTNKTPKNEIYLAQKLAKDIIEINKQ